MTYDEIMQAIPQMVLEQDDSDYKKDGIIYCGICNTPKQIRVDGRIYNCLCRHKESDRDKLESELKEMDRMNTIMSMRISGIQDSLLMESTFDKAEDSENIRMAKNYVAKWEDMFKKGIGLLMFGDTGTGKSFASACIANALIDKRIPVLMTSIPKILSAVQSMSGEERQKYLDSLEKFSLLILDDLGTERNTAYALEIVYLVIDNWVKTKKPMIVSTNLTLGEMSDEQNTDYKRIYSRILGNCVPMKFTGEDRRRKAATDNLAFAAALLKGEA